MTKTYRYCNILLLCWGGYFLYATGYNWVLNYYHPVENYLLVVRDCSIYFFVMLKTIYSLNFVRPARHGNHPRGFEIVGFYIIYALFLLVTGYLAVVLFMQWGTLLLHNRSNNFILLVVHTVALVCAIYCCFADPVAPRRYLRHKK